MFRRLAVPILLLLVVVAGCSGSAQSEAEPAASEPESDGGWSETAEIDHYTVRGEIVAMPDAESPRTIRVHHEAIPDFRNADGEVVGMAAMTMPFPLAEGLGIDGFDVGDKVEMTLEVTQDPEAMPPYRVTRLLRLDPETALEF